MTSNHGADLQPEQESVVLASFDSYRHAEHMLASLGRQFRSDARKGDATAVVVTANKDGSLKLTQSRVLTAGGLGYAAIKVSLVWMVGFHGIRSMLKGARGGIKAARVRKRHVGSDEHRAHEILGDAGPNAALILARCRSHQTNETVAEAAAAQAAQSWEGTLPAFVAALDPSGSHDWVREALDKTSHTSRHHRPTDQPPQ